MIMAEFSHVPKKKVESMGKIAAVKRFEIHDGDGIRTTLFLKGCPLQCRWCHNPECISARAEMAYYPAKCIHCGQCAQVCPTGAQQMTANGHVFDRTKCTGCGLCEAVCLHQGIEGMALTSVYHLENQGYVRVHHESCKRCGMSIALDTEDGLCIACAAKKRGRR